MLLFTIVTTVTTKTEKAFFRYSKFILRKFSLTLELDKMSEVQAASGPAPKPGKFVKVSLYLKKLPHVSDDHFHAYWANNHLVPAFAHKKFMDKVRRYNQVRPSR